MAIGTSKVGALGGLVPGGTETFNASGTFVVPPGVKKVSITGYGGAGNPGNPGNAGNPGNSGSGGGAGSGGNVACRCNGNQNPGDSRAGGFAWKISAFNVCSYPTPNANIWNVLRVPGGASPAVPGKTGRNPGTTGCAGTGGSAGSAGNPGNTGSASTGLCQTFPGGAGGNGGAAGNAGTGGAGGTGGTAGNCGASANRGNGGAGGNCAGSGGAGLLGRDAVIVTSPPTLGGTILGGGGGGGAGVNTSGSPAGPTPIPWGTPPSFNPYFDSPAIPTRPQFPDISGGAIRGGAGGVGTGYYTTGCFTTYMGYGGSGDWSPISTSYFNNPTTFGSAFCGKPGAYVDNVTMDYNTTNGFFQRSATITRTTNGNPFPRSWMSVLYGCGPCVPIQHRQIANNAPAPLKANAGRAGGGGGAGNQVQTAPPYAPAYKTVNATAGGGGGGGGGGRGGAGNAGGAGGAGNAGSPGTPSTVNCVSVTPGSPYPIVVGCGGQVVISWNPQ